jgi:hypothetical protein
MYSKLSINLIIIIQKSEKYVSCSKLILKVFLRKHVFHCLIVVKNIKKYQNSGI